MIKQEEAISIYFHIPFCISKCPYCDFNSIALSPIPEKKYTQALIEEIDYCVKYPLKNLGKRKVASIFFGGGTPSLFYPDSIAKCIEKVLSLFSPGPDMEVTLEVNPKTADRKELNELCAGGINRLSIGVQSFQDKFLKNLGRAHDSSDAVRVLEDAKMVGFSNISIDLIFGIPDQTLIDWERDLDYALSVNPEHLSVYNLTIEEKTPFRELQRQGKITLPDEDTQVRMYGLAQEMFTEAGYEQYEISNYASPGFRCTHNEGYWTLKEYLGFGAGAHSYLREGLYDKGWGTRWKNESDPFEYISRLSDECSVVTDKEQLTKEEAIKEAIFLGLRRMEGICLDDFEDRFGLSLDNTFSEVIPYLVKEDLISIKDGHIKLTNKGILLSDDVFLNFF